MLPKSSSVGRKLLSGSVSQVVSLIAAAVSSFFLMPFIVHHVGDRLYGFWALAWTIIGYYGLLDLGLSSAISQYICVALGKNETSECCVIFNIALRIQTLFGAVALLITVLIALATPWFCHNSADVPVFRQVILLLGIGEALAFPARVYRGVLESELRFDIPAGLAIFGTLLRTGLMMSAIVAGGGLRALAWMSFLSTLPVNGIQILLGRREAAWARIKRVTADWERVKNFFAYSVYTFLTLVADILRFQIAPLVISAMIGLEAVTHYRIAGMFAQYFLLMIASVGMLRPVFSRLHGANNQAALQKAFFFGTKLSLWASTFICLALIGWGKPFIARWMGLKYEDAFLPLVVLSIAVFLDVSQKPSIDLLYATFRHRFYTYMNWGEGVLTLVFSLALARPLGILGVALGTLIAALFIRVLVQPWWICRATEIPLGAYLRTVQGTVLRCCFIMGAVIAISWWGLRPGYPWLFGSAVFATVLYAAISWQGVFNKGERDYLLGVLRGHRDGRVESASMPAPVLEEVL